MLSTLPLKKSSRILGTVEILVANAGITRDQLMLRMSDDDFSQ